MSQARTTSAGLLSPITANYRTLAAIACIWITCFSGALRANAQSAPPAAAVPSPAAGRYDNTALRGTDPEMSPKSDGKNPAGASDSINQIDFRRVVISLAIVLALVFLCRWAAKWFFPSAAVGRSSQVMKVLSRAVIAPRQQLLLVQVGKRLVMVGDCGQQMSALAEITDPDEVATLLGQLRADTPAPESTNPFAPLLGRARAQFDESTVPSAGEPDDEDSEMVLAGVAQTRTELSGLTEKIRMLSQALGGRQ